MSEPFLFSKICYQLSQWISFTAVSFLEHFISMKVEISLLFTVERPAFSARTKVQSNLLPYVIWHVFGYEKWSLFFKCDPAFVEE